MVALLAHYGKYSMHFNAKVSSTILKSAGIVSGGDRYFVKDRWVNLSNGMNVRCAWITKQTNVFGGDVSVQSEIMIPIDSIHEFIMELPIVVDPDAPTVEGMEF